MLRRRHAEPCSTCGRRRTVVRRAVPARSPGGMTRDDARRARAAGATIAEMAARGVRLEVICARCRGKLELPNAE